MATRTAGPLVRDWRVRRRRSQMDLALRGRRLAASPELRRDRAGRGPARSSSLALADRLEVPLRDRNDLLLAAGYAPRYRRDARSTTPRCAASAPSLQRMLDAHDPYPGVVIDRQWNVVLANRAAGCADSSGSRRARSGPPLNVYRACLHPDGLARRTRNFGEWAGYLLRPVAPHDRRSPPIRRCEQLLDEVSAYPNVAALATGASSARGDEPPLLIPLRLDVGDDELSLFTTLTTFGTPRDVTLDELAVELFFPADDASDASTARMRRASLPDT